MNFKEYNLLGLSKTSTSIQPKKYSPKRVVAVNIEDMAIKDIEKLVERIVLGGYCMPSLIDKILLNYYDNR